MKIVTPIAIPQSAVLAAWQTLFALLATAWILGCCLPDRGQSVPQGGFSGSWGMRWLGRLSYGIYLWHLPLIVLLRPWMRPLLDAPWKLPLGLLVALLPVVLLSYLSWRWIEAPARRWCRQRGQPQTNR